MQRMRLLVATLAVLLSTASLAFAEATTWKIDAVHSDASFSVRHFFSPVHGRFNTMSGTIVFDDKVWSNSSVETVIDANSVFTNNEKRDNHLRNSDFFDVANHPTITFKSTKVTKGKDKDFTIEGDLTMRGVTRKVVLDAVYLGAGDFGPMGAKAGFTATTKVNRQDYGIKWNRALDTGGAVLDDNVTITLNIEANKVVETPAGTK